MRNTKLCQVNRPMNSQPANGRRIPGPLFSPSETRAEKPGCSRRLMNSVSLKVLKLTKDSLIDYFWDESQNFTFASVPPLQVLMIKFDFYFKKRMGVWRNNLAITNPMTNGLEAESLAGRIRSAVQSSSINSLNTALLLCIDPL